jgi:hypothetical protein
MSHYSWVTKLNGSWLDDLTSFPGRVQLRSVWHLAVGHLNSYAVGTRDNAARPFYWVSIIIYCFKCQLNGVCLHILMWLYDVAFKHREDFSIYLIGTSLNDLYAGSPVILWNFSFMYLTQKVLVVHPSSFLVTWCEVKAAGSWASFVTSVVNIAWSFSIFCCTCVHQSAKLRDERTFYVRACE